MPLIDSRYSIAVDATRIVDGAQSAPVSHGELTPRSGAVSMARLVPVTSKAFWTALPMSEPVVLVRNLTKEFNGLLAVDGISFEIQRAECFGILGPNGA